MTRQWSGRWSVFAVLALLFTASCDQGGPDTLLGPTPAEVVGEGTSAGGKAGLSVIASPQGVTPSVTASVTVGPLGGSLKLARHRLTVPKNAVLVPTIFTMTTLTNGQIGVELTAVRASDLVDVGELGFLRPISLKLSYARANIIVNPANLVIVHDDDGNYVQLPSTVDVGKKHVHAKLAHFSKYLLATN